MYMGGTASFKDSDLEDIIRFSVLPRRMHKLPSTSDKAKRAKDALEKDPYNVELINQLGQIYASEAQWDKAANVMIRGWKRAAELKDPNDRFAFLMRLGEASFRNHQFRQTEAILRDIDEPEDYYDRKAFQLLSCHTYAEVGDAPRALEVFSKAIASEDFDNAIKIWAAAALRLKKVGAFEAAKNSVLNKARSGPNYHMDQSRMTTVESWAIMSANPEQKDMFDFSDGIPRWAIAVAVGLVLLLVCYVLYVLEQRSLQSMNIDLR